MNTTKTQPVSINDKLIRDLVIARLKSLPSGRKIALGSVGEFTRDELVNKVEDGDEVGKKIIEIQLEYLRSLKTILNNEE